MRYNKGLILTAAVVVSGLSSGGLAAETRMQAAALDTFPLGEVVDSVVSISDQTQSYALYLPSEYDAGRPWPVLYLLDPRGRALIPMELFKEAAERHGWIILSSYNTLSDGPVEPNEIALDAMLGDTQQLFAADLKRLYLGGFSGTAKAAWRFAAGLEGHVAGVIGFGGGLPGGRAGIGLPSALESYPFSFFSAAGNTDFNYENMQDLDLLLDMFDMPHRLVLFEGAHSWPTKEVADRAVAWMELQAIKATLRPGDNQLVDELFNRWLGEARALDAEERPLAAAEAYRAVLDDFVNLIPVTELTEIVDRAIELEKSDEVKDLLERKRKMAEEDREFAKKVTERLGKVRSSGSAAKEAEKTIRELKIEELRRRAAATSDTAEALAAQRMLETVFVNTIFYLPREFLDNGEPERALASLAVARAAKPESPRVCYQEARAHAAAGHTEEALDALECLVDTEVVHNPSSLETETYLKTLSGEARFAELVERARTMAAENSDPSEEGS